MSLRSPSIPPDPSPEPVFRLSVQQYHRMIDAGVLTDDDPVELLEGLLVFKIPKKPAHRLVLRKLMKALDALLPPGWFAQSQEPITLSNGEPEPDAAVVRGSDEQYAMHHPGPGDLVMVAEVADTTLTRDRTIKLRSYAAAGIPVYWIVNLPERSVEVYTLPHSGADEPRYTSVQAFSDSQPVELIIDGRRLGSIAVKDLLPPADADGTA